jgi:hypothetical protein
MQIAKDVRFWTSLLCTRSRIFYNLFEAEFVYVGDEELGSAEFEENIGR